MTPEDGERFDVTVPKPTVFGRTRPTVAEVALLVLVVSAWLAVIWMIVAN